MRASSPPARRRYGGYFTPIAIAQHTQGAELKSVVRPRRQAVDRYGARVRQTHFRPGSRFAVGADRRPAQHKGSCLRLPFALDDSLTGQVSVNHAEDDALFHRLRRNTDPIHRLEAAGGQNGGVVLAIGFDIVPQRTQQLDESCPLGSELRND